MYIYNTLINPQQSINQHPALATHLTTEPASPTSPSPPWNSARATPSPLLPTPRQTHAEAQAYPAARRISSPSRDP
ncbi:hypothetical protein I7I48_00323 [Histoplasma ohiense]|nr:hypothetical protein I7I48_00323 [Histoplasma ohiense (nom. inval.)]